MALSGNIELNAALSFVFCPCFTGRALSRGLGKVWRHDSWLEPKTEGFGYSMWVLGCLLSYPLLYFHKIRFKLGFSRMMVPFSSPTLHSFHGCLMNDYFCDVAGSCLAPSSWQSPGSSFLCCWLMVHVLQHHVLSLHFELQGSDTTGTWWRKGRKWNVALQLNTRTA